MDLEKMFLKMLEVIEEQNKETEEWRRHDRKKFKGMVIVAVVGLLLLGFITYCMYFTPTRYSIEGDNNNNSNSSISQGGDE